MATITEANVERKLQTVSATQDSIQSISLWVIHHKASHEKIVEIWFKVLKKSKIPHRLTLFYLCNDIVQTCKRKHAIIYKDAFKEVLKDAVLLVRDASIRGNVDRLFKIWKERNVYDAEFIEELISLHENVKSSGKGATTALNSRLLAEFQPAKVIEKLEEFTKLEHELEVKKAQVAAVRLDASNIEAIRTLKDRSVGKEYTQQFEDNCVKLEDCVEMIQKEIKERSLLIELLEQSELFYDAQYGEAKIVANAYKNFGTRVSNLKRKLEEHEKTLPSPLPSPSPDAPSPGNTPPEAHHAVDNTDPMDMEMSDEEDECLQNILEMGGGGGSRLDNTSTTRSYPLPIPSVTKIQMKTSDTKKQPGTKVASGQVKPEEEEPFASFLEQLMSGKKTFQPGVPESSQNSNSTTTWNPVSGLQTTNSEAKPIPTIGKVGNRDIEFSPLGQDDMDGDGTPVKDEREAAASRGGGTPVLDEKSEIPEKSVSNPIEFLTQLISQTQKANQGSTNFLQSLSALTKNVQNQYQDKRLDDDGNTVNTESAHDSPSSWAEWKQAKEPPPPPPPPPPPTSQVHIGPSPVIMQQQPTQQPPPGYVPPSQPHALPNMHMPPPGPHQQAPAPVPPPQQVPPPMRTPPPSGYQFSMPPPGPPQGVAPPQHQMGLPLHPGGPPPHSYPPPSPTSQPTGQNTWGNPTTSQPSPDQWGGTSPVNSQPPPNQWQNPPPSANAQLPAWGNTSPTTSGPRPQVQVHNPQPQNQWGNASPSAALRRPPGPGSVQQNQWGASSPASSRPPGPSSNWGSMQPPPAGPASSGSGQQQNFDNPGMGSPIRPSTPKGILCNSRSNLTTIQPMEIYDDKGKNDSTGSIPTIGTQPVRSITVSGPRPPSHPPASLGVSPGPRPMLTMPPLTEGQAQEEFIEKLKRKSSISTPTTPTTVASNLRTLTEVKMNAGEAEMEVSNEGGQQIKEEESNSKNEESKNNKEEENHSAGEDSEVDEKGTSLSMLNRGPSSIVVQPLKNRETVGSEAWQRDREGRISPRGHRDSGGEGRYEREPLGRDREVYREPTRYREYSQRGREYMDYHGRREPGRPDLQRRPNPRDMFYRDPYTGRMRPNFPLPPPPPPVNRRGYYPRY